MRKKFTISIFLCLALLGILSYTLKQGGGTAPAVEGKLDVYFFYSDSCPYCAKMKPFLEGLANEHPEMFLKETSISSQQGSHDLLGFYQKYNVPKEAFGSVPIVFIKEKYFVGFSEENTKSIEVYVSGLTNENVSNQGFSTSTPAQKSSVEVPFLGRIDTEKYSLGVLAVTLGFFDGFNVCSLGALVLILGLVLIFKSKKKILVFGGIYILATAVVYGLLISLWYHMFIFLAPYLKIMETLVGLLGILGGIYFIEDFLEFRKKGAQCNMQNTRVMKRLSDRIQKVLQSEEKSIIAIALSVLLFSMIITIVEFPCSAAVPLFFAGALAEAHLGFFHYLAYLALFILFYIADEIIVFLIAISTMTIRLASQRFVLWITLIEAIVLFTLGLYYLFGFLIL